MTPCNSTQLRQPSPRGGIRAPGEGLSPGTLTPTPDARGWWKAAVVTRPSWLCPGHPTPKCGLLERLTELGDPRVLQKDVTQGQCGGRGTGDTAGGKGPPDTHCPHMSTCSPAGESSPDLVLLALHGGFIPRQDGVSHRPLRTELPRPGGQGWAGKFHRPISRLAPLTSSLHSQVRPKASSPM